MADESTMAGAERVDEELVGAEPGAEQATATGAEIVHSEAYLAQAQARQKVGGILCYVLGLCTVMLDAAQCWDVYRNAQSLDWLTIAVTNFPVMWITVSYMGMLSKERRDILSAVVGESGTRPGLLDAVIQVAASRRGVK